MSDPSEQYEHGALIDHLFRREAGQVVSTLTRFFGPRHIDLIEDSVQDALVKAMRNWRFRGVPENPRGWILSVAKNSALDSIRRESSFLNKQGEVFSMDLSRNGEKMPSLEEIESDLRDDQLRMIFMCCHPSISRESQVALTLKTVGGFGVLEIAKAFLTPEVTIAQRLVRAKRTVREGDIPFETPDRHSLPDRIDSVLEVLYLLFNEGYSAHVGDDVVRYDLCAEAVRLCSLVAHHPLVDLPKVHALFALMLLQSSRLPARTDPMGDIILLEDQDRSLWDRAMIVDGLRQLDVSAAGTELSKYHLEAGIASLHAIAPSFAETNWNEILSHYDALLVITSSPVVALNRAIALAMVHGWRAGIRELETLNENQNTNRYHLYFAALAELYLRAGDLTKSAENFQRAIELAPTEAEGRFLRKRKSGAHLGHLHGSSLRP